MIRSVAVLHSTRGNVQHKSSFSRMLRIVCCRVAQLYTRTLQHLSQISQGTFECCCGVAPLCTQNLQHRSMQKIVVAEAYKDGVSE
jgi:hypothetical protein